MLAKLVTYNSQNYVSTLASDLLYNYSSESIATIQA